MLKKFLTTWTNRQQQQLYQRCFHTHSFLNQRYHKQHHYDILQVHRQSDKKTIKAQYYRLSKRYHPDLNPTDKEAHAKFLQVNDAYAVLGNEASRRQYDAELDRTHPSSSSFSSSVNQASSVYYGASRPGYSGPSVAWRAKRKQAKNTGSASARAQAEYDHRRQSPHFNHHEHYAKHYQAEELRRRERVMNAAKRRKDAGIFDNDDEGGDSKQTNDRRLTVWSRLWRLGVLLMGISYVTRQLLDYDEDQKKKPKKNGFLVD
ncbi:uncharacterized protein BX664DRAFT_329959 [Halteromyces radiatus]|uniref:uncharacterized protein n=1 Tax=Halteromyces radiatus TaxID=101107 RepID=UPI00221EB976|nr:uncharacterized protein BX664DRAFT_329959 [Halteromyces radiatus]KAI8093549.1 hypothetical protein BX664DRAFT_329959 [Halteromyces radiatus]